MRMRVNAFELIHVQMNHKNLHEQMQVNEREKSNKNKDLNQRKEDALRTFNK